MKPSDNQEIQPLDPQVAELKAEIQRLTLENQLLRRTQEDLYRAQAVAHTGNWRLDVRQNQLIWSEETYRMFGIPVGTELTYEIFLAAVHPDDRDFVDRAWQAALSGAPYDIEHRILVGKEVKWVLERAELEFEKDGSLLGGFGAVQDITDLKRVEEALRKLSNAVEHSPACVVITDKSGLIEYVNPKFVQLTGYSFEEAVGKNPRILKTGWTPPRVYKELWDTILAGQSWQGEFCNRKKDGEIYWEYAYIMPILAENKAITHFVAVKEDITQRRQAEQTLQRNRRILAQAEELTHLGAWEIEIHDHQDLNNNPLHWSDEIYRIFGYAPGEVDVTNELFFSHVHPDDRIRIGQAVSEAISEKKPYHIEHRIRRADGTERFVVEHAEMSYDSQGRLERIFGAVQDITERKQAEQALLESEIRLRQLADAMPQLVWTAQPDGSVDYYNERASFYDGIRVYKDGSWDLGPVVHPEDKEQTSEAWQIALETGEIYQIEHRLRMADGTYRWHLSRGLPVSGENGAVDKWFGTATDIHDQKEVEEALSEYAKKLERSNQELENFAFAASHDLQEPLRKISSFGSRVVERLKADSDEETLDNLRRMMDASRRMQDMIDGLLQLSRINTSAKPYRVVDLNRVAETVISDLEALIETTQGKVILEPLPSITAEPVQMQQLFLNLIGNGLKFHKPAQPPVVRVSCEVSPAGARPREIKILVEDNGIGFDEQYLSRIFKPFARLVGRSHFPGSGMGLVICQKIVERHQGSITAHSRPGEGSTFIVTLPLAFRGTLPA